MRWLRIFRSRRGVSCLELARLLADYLQGETDPGTSRSIDRHLEECEECRNFSDSYRKTPQLLREAGGEGMPDEFRRRLEETLLGKLERERG